MKKILFYIFLIIILIIIFQIYDKHFKYSFKDKINVAYKNGFNICLGNFNLYNKDIVNTYLNYIDLVDKKSNNRNNIDNTNNIHNTNNIYDKGKVSVKISHLGKNNSERLINFEKIIDYAKDKNIFIWISALTPNSSDLEYNFYTYFKNANYSNIGLTIASSNKRCDELVDNILSLNGHIRLVKGLYTRNEKEWDIISHRFLENSKKLINSNLYHTIATHDFEIINSLDLTSPNIEYSFYFSSLKYIKHQIKKYKINFTNKSLYISSGDFEFFLKKSNYFDFTRSIKREINSLVYL